MKIKTDIQQLSQECRTRVNQRLEVLIGNKGGDQLTSALRYSLLAPGKRLRPLICMMSCHSLGGSLEHALDPACAIEMIHTASLIVDDLPCMDDATMRRCMPACHCRFGEATSILTALELMSLGYRVMSESPGVGAEPRNRLVQTLARAVGINGMIGGQELDLEALQTDGDKEVDADHVAHIHELKTSSLFIAAAESGATVAGLEDHQMTPIRQFAARLGLAYQTLDDLLDVQGTAEATGKDVGKDADKPTLVGALGEDSAENYARNMISAAMSALQPLGRDMTPLEDLALSLVGAAAPVHQASN